MKAALCIAGGLLMLANAVGAQAAPTAAKHEVAIDGTRYTPATITVKRGETVTWVNRDPFPHTVTAAGAFDSREIRPNGTWKYVAKKPGEYAYICTLHPNMKGTLKVE